jgi:adenosylmethionine-8-amino-7-oxononanoate aminotransferase
MHNRDKKNIDICNIWHPYTDIDSPIENYHCTDAVGVHITLNNMQVIDGMSSWWAAIFGYNHPILNKAIIDQVKKFSHIMFGGITHNPAIQLSEKLLEILPQRLDKIFYSDSGSVAVEVAMKMALQYQHNLGKSKHKFITIQGGYHGDTFGAMSVASENGMHSAFKHNTMQNIFAIAPTLHNVDDAIQDLRQKLHQHQDIAAMILEPIVQGAGGMHFYSPLYLQAVRKLCDEFEILLIVDEIATGFGRTGKLFACEYGEITPDILCAGKALTGGYMSLGATITTDDIAKKVGVLMHGPTFMANPLATSVALASLTLLQEYPWQQQVQMIEEVLTSELLPLIEFDCVADARVLGAIGVIEFTQHLDIGVVQQLLIENGVWLRPFGKLLYTMPPFIVKKEELLQITTAMKEVVKHYQ